MLPFRGSDRFGLRGVIGDISDLHDRETFWIVRVLSNIPKIGSSWRWDLPMMHCGRVHFGPARQAALGWARPDHYATISQARMDASHAFEWLWLKGQIRTHAQGMAQCPGGINLVPPGTKACVCASECRERNSR